MSHSACGTGFSKIFQPGVWSPEAWNLSKVRIELASPALPVNNKGAFGKIKLTELILKGFYFGGSKTIRVSYRDH